MKVGVLGVATLGLYSFIGLPVRSIAQGERTLLIVSQPAGDSERSAFVDLAPFVARQVADAGKLRPLVYKPNLPAVRDALATHALSPADLGEPMTREAVRKLARALGVRFTLRLSARLAKEGVAADAEMEALTGQQTWAVIFVQKLDPFRPKNRKSMLLEGVSAHSAAIAAKIGSPQGRIPVTAPVEVAIPPAGRDKGKPKLGRPASGTQGSAEKDKPGGARDAGDGKSAAAPTDALAKPPESNQPAGRPANGRATPPAGAAPGSAGQRDAAAAVVSANEILVERFRRQGDLANMIVSLRRAVTDKPHEARLRRDLVQTYLDRGWQAAARDEATRAISLFPDDAPLHRLLADSIAGIGDPEGALKEYLEAVRINGKDAANHMALGDGYWNAGHLDEARRTFVEAAAADPKNPAPYRRLARLYAVTGRFKECAAAMTAARERTPAEDLGALTSDYAAILTTAEGGLGDVLGRLHSVRQELVSGTLNREKSFAGASAEKRRAEEITSFLEGLIAPAGYQRIQDMYLQAANLTVQAAESALQWIETQDSRKDDECALFRVEASKQLAEAGKRLKAARPPVPKAPR